MFVVGMVGLHLLLVVNLWGRISRGYPDFTVFYTAARVLRGGLGHRLYDPQVQYQAQKSFAGEIPSRHGPLPYIHPPFEALIFLPLTLLPYRHAFAAWDLLNIGVLFGVAFLLRRSVRTLGAIPLWEFVLGCLAFFPVFACLLQGQDSILLLLLCTLGFNALKREANFLAGCWFALGVFKFQLMVPIVLLLILSTRRRVAMGFAAVSILLALVSVGLVGWSASLSGICSAGGEDAESRRDPAGAHAEPEWLGARLAFPVSEDGLVCCGLGEFGDAVSFRGVGGADDGSAGKA
jgi:hypothetical protein